MWSAGTVQVYDEVQKLKNDNQDEFLSQDMLLTADSCTHKLVLPAGELVSCVEVNKKRKKRVITWPRSWGQWARTSLKSRDRELFDPSATIYADHCKNKGMGSCYTITHKHGQLWIFRLQNNKTQLDISHTCHRKTQVRRTPSLWGWSGKKPGRGARTTAVLAAEESLFHNSIASMYCKSTF